MDTKRDIEKRNYKKPEQHLFLRGVLFGLLTLSILFFLVPQGKAQEDSLADNFIEGTEEEIHLIRGDLTTIPAKKLERVSIANPEIADIANLDSDKVLLLAKQVGHTNFFMWDVNGKRSFVIRVFDDNLNLVKSRLSYLLSKAGIYGLELNISKEEGKVLVSGEVDEDKEKDYKALIGPFQDSILDLVKKKEEEDLIQVDVIVAEMSSTFTEHLGVAWTGLSALSYTESDYGNKKIDKFGDIFKLGDFKRTTPIIATINAAITEGKGRILSKPKLVVISGQEASFLVGGQIPVVTTTTSSGGNVSENVEYKDYGVNLRIKPTLRNPTLKDKSKIKLDINIEVSDLDAANAVSDKTAFTTRTAQTVLMLDNGQTVVLAGLIKDNKTDSITRIPFFSDIPLVGALFRDKTHSPDKQTELVVSLTPTVIPQKENSTFRQTTTVKRSKKGALPQQASLQTQAQAMSSPMQKYVQQIQQLIANNINYPPQAKLYGWEGTVKLNLLLLKDGTLAYAGIAQSSGRTMFDENALETAKSLAPYGSFPSGSDLEEISITIPIEYHFN